MTNEQLEVFSYCGWYLNSMHAAYIFNTDFKREFMQSLDMYAECIKKLEGDEKCEQQFLDSIRSKLCSSINVLKNLILHTKIDDYLSKFLKFYCHICININNNLFHDSNIDLDCDFIQRTTYNFLSLTETLSLFKGVSNSLSGWKTNLPPSFRLSEHYYSLIKEE